MSTNLRKAQKHMQRARELLNPESQLGFGAGDDTPKRSQKRVREEDSIIRTRRQGKIGRIEVNKRETHEARERGVRVYFSYFKRTGG